MLSMSSENTKLHIKQEDKFYSRLLSKETSVANPSFRVYYGGASGAVPFLWESQPGMPKNAVPATTLPPLTPPPSYYSSTPTRTKSHGPKKSPNLIHAILPKLTLKRSAPTPKPPPTTHLHCSASSSSSSSSSSLSLYGRTRFTSPRSSFSSAGTTRSPTTGRRRRRFASGCDTAAAGGLRVATRSCS
uniref:Uncharacterized protein n=1 Tax=Ananas comosus var. bracteatus TaxID=296719 RepID=A0A6V7PDP5_ANACO|nr:unnamed protein product [Ananas comosus var. bracteatus]